MNDVIEALQLQVKQLKDLIMKMSEIVTMDDEKKNTILNEVNQIKEIQVDQINQEIEYVKTNKSTKKEKEQQKDNEKRKHRTPKYQNDDEELTGKLDSYNQWYKDEGIQVMKRKRTTYKKNE